MFFFLYSVCSMRVPSDGTWKLKMSSWKYAYVAFSPVFWLRNAFRCVSLDFWSKWNGHCTTHKLQPQMMVGEIFLHWSNAVSFTTNAIDIVIHITTEWLHVWLFAWLRQKQQSLLLSLSLFFFFCICYIERRQHEAHTTKLPPQTVGRCDACWTTHRYIARCGPYV